MDKAILVVSFGTSYEETRRKTIERIEERIGEAYPRHKVYRAWTSKMIIKKLRERDGIHISTVCEAMEEMERDGIREVIVQPTHVINGIENDRMKADVEKYRSHFQKIELGGPLLDTKEDCLRVISQVAEELKPEKDEALVLMGHGTEHVCNAIYAELDHMFKEAGHNNIFMGTVEAYPTLEDLLRAVRNTGAKRVVLAPFMIVAGDHARNDMSSEEEGSWKHTFQQEGYEIRCVLKGLGEYKGVQELFLEHIAAAQPMY